MLWTIAKTLFDSLDQPQQADNKKSPILGNTLLKCSFEITEFSLIDLLLSRILDIRTIVYASRDLQRYLFSDNITKNPEYKKLADELFDHSKDIAIKLDNCTDLDNVERMSFLPLSNNLITIKTIMTADSYISLLHNLKNTNYWEYKKILKDQLLNLRKNYPEILNQYFNTINVVDFKEFENLDKEFEKIK